MKLFYHIESCLVTQIRVLDIINIWAYCELAQSKFEKEDTRKRKQRRQEARKVRRNAIVYLKLSK